MEQGAHGASVGVAGNASMSCWTCHDLHQPQGKHNIDTSMTVDGVTLAVDANDNTLCLACHAGGGDFAALTVAQLAANPTGADALNAVNAHIGSLAGAPAKMGNLNLVAGDPKEYLKTVATYGLNSYKNGQCIGCHMPYTVSSSGTLAPAQPSLLPAATGRAISAARTMKAILTAPATAATSCTGCH